MGWLVFDLLSLLAICQDSQILLRLVVCASVQQIHKWMRVLPLSIVEEMGV